MSSIFSTSVSSSGATAADAGIVDEHGDGLVLTQHALHLREIRLVAEVRSQRSDRASGLARQAGGEFLEPRLVAGHQDEVVATLCETVGIDGADAPWRRR